MKRSEKKLGKGCKGREGDVEVEEVGEGGK